MAAAPAAATGGGGGGGRFNAKPPPRVSDVEIAAIHKLVPQSLLFYDNSNAVPVPELKCQVTAQIDDMFNEDDRLKRYVKFHRHPSGYECFGTDVNKEVKPELHKLRDDLLIDVGDDIIAGTIFAPGGGSTATTTTAASTAATPASSSSSSSSAAAAAASSDVTTPSPPPPQQQHEQNTPSPNQTTSFPIKIDGYTYRVPLSKRDAQEVYDSGTPSQFGTVDDGDFFDTSIRSSIEFNANQLGLPPFLRDPRQHFPDMFHEIGVRLCPSARQIAAVPYKLVGYKPGDFFKQHVDSVSDTRHFGTLLIHLPTLADYEDPHPLQDPDAFSYNSKVSEDEDDEYDVDDSGNDDIANVTAAADDDDDDDDSNNSNNNNNRRPRRAQGGRLRFFLGRGFDPGFTSFTKSILNNKTWTTYGRPSKGEDQLVAMVQMQNYDAHELQGFNARERHLGNKLAQPLSGGDAHQQEQQEQQQEKAKDGRRRRQHTPLHYCAFLTNVLHDVRPLRSGMRFVMTYKLLKRGEVSLRIPRMSALTTQLEKLIGTMKRVIAQDAKDKGAKVKRRYHLPRAVGFLLRHSYPLEALKHPGLSLKGIDAVCYQLATSRCECVTIPVFVDRDSYPSAPFVIEDGVHPLVFMSSAFPNGSRDLLEKEDCAREMSKEFPMVYPCLWLSLGFQEVVAGGHSFGNADCGCSWWYRQAALVMTLRPSDWTRRRWAFLAVEKGGENNVFKKISDYYPIFRNVVYFM